MNKYEISHVYDGKWTISFQEPEEFLCKSLLFSTLLSGGVIHHFYKTLGFYAKKVVGLKENMRRMQYQDFVRLAKCISIQIFYLEKLGFTFYGLCLENILVIDDTTYIYIGGNHIKEIVNNQNIYFTSPFQRRGNGGNGENIFLSSEIMSITSLPAYVDYRCVYSSLGELLLYLIGKDGIEIVKDTKLYWFIQRSVKEKVLLFC